jgi:hypothetical protein
MVHIQGNPGIGGAMRMFVVAGLGCAALALGGCSSFGVDQVYTGSFWAQPGKYDFLKCPDLAGRWMAGSTREKEILSLMERADQEMAGPLINLTVYRADLEQVRADMDLVQRTARQKGCENLVGTKK